MVHLLNLFIKWVNVIGWRCGAETAPHVSRNKCVIIYHFLTNHFFSSSWMNVCSISVSLTQAKWCYCIKTCHFALMDPVSTRHPPVFRSPVSPKRLGTSMKWAVLFADSQRPLSVLTLKRRQCNLFSCGEHESICTRLQGSDMTEHFDSNVPLEVSSPLHRMIFEMKQGFHNQSFIGFINHTPHSDSWVCLLRAWDLITHSVVALFVYIVIYLV